MAQKLTYDTTNKLFILNAGVVSLDAKVDLYSDVKEDWLSDSSLTKFKFPMQAIGGQSIGGGQTISPYITLLYGWKIRPQEANHTLVIVGNIITSDASSPFVPTVGAFNAVIYSQVSANSLSSGSGLTVDEHNKLMLTKQILNGVNALQ